MSSIIKRRKFGQLAIASATTTLFTDFASQVHARKPQHPIYGIQLISGTREADSFAEVAKAIPNLRLTELDLLSGKVTSLLQSSNQNIPTRTSQFSASIQFRQNVAGFIAENDGSFVVVIATNTSKGSVSHLVTLNTKGGSERILKVSGLQPNESIESFTKMQNGTLLCLVGLNEGIPPFKLKILDDSGSINHQESLINLQPNYRYSNLAIAPDGKIYATALGGQGTTTLVELNLAQRKIIRESRLKIDGNPIANDIFSLVFSKSGQLFALAEYRRSRTLFAVNVQTGTMEPLRAFSANKLAFT